MHHLTACPLCRQFNFNHFLTCLDHSVSHETFTIQRCQNCGFTMTNPQPNANELPAYYQSDAYISHSDKSQGIIDQLYKVARTYTLKWKYNIIQKHSSHNPSSVLDFGCGTGYFLKTCKEKNLRIAGIEPSDTARSQANIITGGVVVEQPDQIKGKFDAITLWHVLEHISNLHTTLDILSSKLHEHGTIFIAVPNHNSVDAQEYKEFWAAYDVPRHLWHFSRHTMTQLLKLHDFKMVEILPMPLDAYYVSMLSEKYRTGTNGILNLANALLQALKSNEKAKKTKEYSSLIYIARK